MWSMRVVSGWEVSLGSLYERSVSMGSLFEICVGSYHAISVGQHEVSVEDACAKCLLGGVSVSYLCSVSL